MSKSGALVAEERPPLSMIETILIGRRKTVRLTRSRPERLRVAAVQPDP